MAENGDLLMRKAGDSSSVPTFVFVLSVLIHLVCSGCTSQNADASGERASATAPGGGDSAFEWLETSAAEPDLWPPVVRWVSVPGIPKDIALMESVFWEPDDTASLRQTIFSTASLSGSDVLEIGTGSGLISLCCLQAGAARVIATDVNPTAVRNARFNAKEMEFSDRLEVRLVPRRAPGAWTVIEQDARFDVIISNPPWEDRKPESLDQFALYDPDFALLDSLVTGARRHLKPDGRMWLAYGCVTAVRRIQTVAAKENLDCRLLDDRELDSLPELFLPGMLIELQVRK
jgi:release factor glutamine methyltransferase